MDSNNKKIDFTKTPFRGVFKRIANKNRKSPEYIRQAYHITKNPGITKQVNTEVEKILNIYKRKEQLEKEAHELVANGSNK